MVRHSPARALTPDEHELVAEWLASAGDVGTAFVSDRRTDDPAIFHCVVITTDVEDGPSHIIHASAEQDGWVVMVLGKASKVLTFPTLLTALNSVRSVLADDFVIHPFGAS